MAGHALQDRRAITQFEEKIRSLVIAGHGARAIAIVHRAAVANGRNEVAQLIDPATLNPVIDRPEQLLGDCGKLAGLDGNCSTLRLLLCCKSSSATTERQSMIRR